MRCFIAMDLPDAVRAALASAQARLRRKAPGADVRWVEAAASVHLTLRFLGEVDARRLARVRGALADVCARHGALELRAEGLGTFPGPSRPRVVWAGIAGDLAGLRALATDVEHAMVDVGFAPETRPFRGHLTLGRIRTPHGVRPLVEALRAGKATFGAWRAEEVVLFQSHLSPQGARYEVIARWPLAGAPDPIPPA